MNKPDSTQSTLDLIRTVCTSLLSLFQKEMTLARSEIGQNLGRAGVGVGLLVAAMVIAMVALNVLAGAVVAAIVSAGLAPGWSALLVGGLMALIAGLLVMRGLHNLKPESLAPTRTIDSLKRNAAVMKEAVND